MSEDTINADGEAEISTALTTTMRAAMPTVLAADTKDILGTLAAELADFDADVSTKKGREEIASKARKVAVAKMDLVRLADTLKEDAQKTIRATNAEVTIIKDRMDALRDKVREPLTEYEKAEETRVKANEAAITALETLAEGIGDLPPDQIIARLESIQPFDWSVEFRSRGERAMISTTALLRIAIQDAEKRAAEAKAEIERQAMEAEQRRLDALEAQRVREEQIAAEAAARATREAEEKAAHEAQQALREAALIQEKERAEALRKERMAAEAIAHAEQTKQDAIDRAERDRLAALERERLALKAAEDQRQREADEAARKAQQAREALARAEREKVEQAAASERQRVAAEQKAEASRIAAIEAERQRVARETAAQKAEEDKRAANKAHRATINRNVLADLLLAMSEVDLRTGQEADKIGRAIITAIVTGKVRHTAIDYASSTKEGPLL